jgi:hypothetical protein
LLLIPFVFPELAVRNAEGQVETVHYELLNVLLLNELKRLREEVDSLRHQVENQPSGAGRDESDTASATRVTWRR